MKKALPTFLGIGAHKAGTSWLYKQLANHPGIWMPPLKELHFFDQSLHYPSPNDLGTSSPLARILGSKPWERPRMITGFKTIVKHLKAGNFRKVACRANGPSVTTMRTGTTGFFHKQYPIKHVVRLRHLIRSWKKTM